VQAIERTDQQRINRLFGSNVPGAVVLWFSVLWFFVLSSLYRTVSDGSIILGVALSGMVVQRGFAMDGTQRKLIANY
jgi:hypothetical protein